MQTPLAQMAAVTCHGNAAVRGMQTPQFFPGNSTCQFCESITFLVSGKPAGGESQSAVFADTPDAWIRDLRRRSLVGFRLRQQPQDRPGFSDRNSSGFVGGGRLWMIEAVREGKVSEFWLNKWEVGNRDAPDRRIWRVTYGLYQVVPTPGFALRPLGAIIDDFRSALKEIRAFAEAHECGNFTRFFDDALRAFDDPQADLGYHKDLFPQGSLGDNAAAVLKAAQCAWVFGGMGSWNDMSFRDETQKEYERVSDALFGLLNESVEAAATSSFPANE
ncbi:MAG TPA: hypothetical protein VMU48_10410 [Terracidiphilus sp.]|nr:hypothetical protein [Terracidiphilus sp.]